MTSQMQAVVVTRNEWENHRREIDRLEGLVNQLRGERKWWRGWAWSMFCYLVGFALGAGTVYFAGGTR